MSEHFLLTWNYQPCDLFKQSILLSNLGMNFSIHNGVIKVEGYPINYVDDAELVKCLQYFLESFFISNLIFRHDNFSLTLVEMTRVLPDMKEVKTIFPDDSMIKTSAESVDLVVKSSNGKVSVDTYQESIKRIEKYSKLIHEFQLYDATLSAILLSFKKSFSELDNTLVYLYEIRDALVTRFGSRKDAWANVGVLKQDFVDFENMCNMGVKPSRHRGRFAGILRDANPEEIELARLTAQKMIIGYLNFLDNHR